MSSTRSKRFNGLGPACAAQSGLVAVNRERIVTVGCTTVLRVATVLLGLAAVIGCGGRHGDTYAKATNAQESCCEHLAGEARAACLQKIVRVEDPKVASSRVNQDTFACVVKHFVCDATTGAATKDSAQSQLECIQDLPR
ncbi:MAG: hypothetical protein KBG15_16950 [Kofleriaceae bacterium]|nr:hypothetical protein [Kofleriaceae bacterium]